MNGPEDHNRLLRLLYVDDEEGLREVTKLYLERAGDILVDTAESAAEAFAMMRKQPYDAIISDYQMPVMDGVKFLKAVRASGMIVPFLLFTGKGREDVVIEAYECGANFYIQKGGESKSQYAELLHKVRQAVELHEVQLALGQSEEFYQRLYNETPLGILYYDAHGVILDCNEKFVEIIGSSKCRLIGLDMLQELDDMVLIREVTSSLTSGKGDYKGPYASVTADKTTHVKILFKGLRSPSGDIYGGIGLIEDATEQMHAEERLTSLAEEYEMMFMGTQDAMFLIGVGTGEFRYIRNNRSHHELTGFSLDAIKGKTPHELLGRELGDTVAANYQRCVDARSPVTYEETLALPIGKKMWKTTLTPVFEQGTVRYIIGSAHDITDYWQAMAQARESDESYQAIVENLNEVLYTLDCSANVKYVSPNIEPLSGYSPSEVLGRCFVEFVHPDDRGGQSERFTKTLSGDMDSAEYRMVTKDGRTVWVRSSARPIVREGVVSGVRGVLDDISKRKEAEMALRESELNFRTLFEESRDAIWVTASNGFVIEANSASFSLLGYARTEFIGIEASNLYADPADRERFIQRIHEHGFVKDYEVLLRRKNGSTVLCSFTSHLWQNGDGDIIGYRGIVRDISNQKCLERSLREQSRLQQLLIDISSRFLGLPSERIDSEIGLSLAQLGMAVSADRAYVYAYDFANRISFCTHEWYTNDIEQQEGALGDMPFSHFGDSWIETHKMGEIINILDILSLPSNNMARRKLEAQGIRGLIAVPIMDGSRCRGFIGVGNVREHHVYTPPEQQLIRIFANMLIPVQNRKKMEQDLMRSEHKFRTYIESAPEGIFVIDSTGHYVEANAAASAMTGYSQSELQGMHVSDLASPNAPSLTIEPFSQLREVGTVQAEVLLRRKDGTDFPAALSAASLFESGYIGFCTDITKRKHAEWALGESEEKYRLITENMGDNVTVMDLSLNIVYTSPSVETMRGYSVEEVMQQTPADILTPKSLKAVMGTYAEQMKMEATGSIGPRDSINIEVEEYHKNGSIITMEATVSLLRDHGGDPTHIIIISRDISERIRSEQALRLATRKLGILSEITRHDVNNKLTALLGYVDLARISASDGNGESYLDKIHSNAAMIREQLAFAKAYESLGNQEPQWQNLGELLGSIHFPDGADIAASCQATAVYADTMLYQVFVTLLDNSLRHGAPAAHITIACSESPDGLLISWEDDGVGVAYEEKEMIFQRGYGKNTGLGLFLAREILAITGITISEAGVPGEGATFELLVPSEFYRIGT